MEGSSPPGANHTREYPTVSLGTLFRDLSVPRTIDYFSLDIEGAQDWVMETFPWDTYKWSSGPKTRSSQR
jgi:hypothetical protein